MSPPVVVVGESRDALTIRDPIVNPEQNGSFPAKNQCGGRERSISPPSDQKIGFAGFAVRTRRCGLVGRKPCERGPVRDREERGRCETGRVPGSQVCTPDMKKTAVVENSMLARVCRRFAAQKPEIGRRHTGCRGLQKLDTLRSRSDHAIYPLAGIVVRQHHIQAQATAQARDRAAHCVELPAGGQHQLQAGCTLRTAQPRPARRVWCRGGLGCPPKVGGHRWRPSAGRHPAVRSNRLWGWGEFGQGVHRWPRR